MKNNYQFKNRFLSTIFFVFIILFGFVKCSDVEEENPNFPFTEFMDNTESLKGKTFTSKVDYQYDTKYVNQEGLNLREILNKSENGISIVGSILSERSEDMSTERGEVIFFIPKDIENTIPNISTGTTGMIEFICEEGNKRSGNRVISISRIN